MADRKLFNKYIMLFGILAPAPIISLFSKTAYIYFLVITVLLIFIHSIKNKFGYSKKIDRTYVVYFAIVMISSIVCFIRMPSNWTSDVITLVIQYICILIIYLWFDKSKNIDFAYSFVKGVYVSSVIQMIWGYMQLVLYSIGIDLNAVIFGNLLHMYNSDATQLTLNGSLKVSGFCWNAGNFAPLMVIGYFLSNNIIIKIAFVVISLLSGSRTLMFGMLICLCLQTVSLIKRKLKFTPKKLLICGAIFFISLVVIVLNYSLIQNKISTALASLNFIKNYSIEGSTNTHIMYLLNTFDIIKKNDLITNLFGYGPNCSGYAFVSHYNFYSNIGKWCVECDYVNILWNYGLLGCFTYYFWLFKNIFKPKGSFKRMLFFITFLIMGLMYNITFNWVSLFLIFIFIMSSKGIDIFKGGVILRGKCSWMK